MKTTDRFLGCQLTMKGALLASLLVLGGCATTEPTNFYLLQAMPASATNNEANTGDGVSLGVGPIELPPYLDRPQIVTRAEGNQLDLAEYAQWAEPLKDNVTRVLADNLSVLVPAGQVATYPWKRSAALKYQVAVDVRRFDASLGHTSRLVAHWSVLDEDGEKTLVSKKSAVDVPVAAAPKTPDGTTDYGPTVLAMNTALTMLSKEIAEHIRALE